jgi:limonene 1,2-monooxygenase
MEESLAVIMRLLRGEVVDHQSDWFELRNARLQLLPYTKPHFPVAVASQISPSGFVAAGKNGVGVLSLGAGMVGGKESLRANWALAERNAAEHGTTVDRSQWRLVMPGYIAETREEAIRDIEAGRRRESIGYFQDTLGRPFEEVPIEQLIENDVMLVGSPEDAIASIERLLEATGGFGGVLFVANEWTTREKTMHSFELFARYVMPRFQNVLAPIEGSQQWVSPHRREIFLPSLQAVANAFTAAGREVPEELLRRGAHRAQ